MLIVGKLAPIKQVHLFLKMIWKTACDLEEFWFAEVCPDVLW